MDTLGKGLGRLQVGSRVGLMVDSSNNLHLYIDGQHQGVVPVPVTRPCFAVFDICNTVTKVRDTRTHYITQRSLGLLGKTITVS